MLDPERYFPVDRMKLTERMILVVHELTELRTSLHEAQCTLRREYDKAMQIEAGSVSAAKEYANSMTLVQRNNVGDLERQVVSQEDERELIRDLLRLCDDA